VREVCAYEGEREWGEREILLFMIFARGGEKGKGERERILFDLEYCATFLKIITKPYFNIMMTYLLAEITSYSWPNLFVFYAVLFERKKREKQIIEVQIFM